MERKNIIAGIAVLVFFLVLGAYLKSQIGSSEEWMKSMQHGLWKAAHVHGTIFGILNILLGILIATFSLDGGLVKAASILALVGLIFMPFGLFLWGISPLFQFMSPIGGFSMIISWVLTGIAFVRR